MCVRINLRHGHKLLHGLEEVDKMTGIGAVDTKVSIAKGLHGITERVQCQKYFPDHPSGYGGRNSKEDIHADAEAPTDLREDISVVQSEQRNIYIYHLSTLSCEPWHREREVGRGDGKEEEGVLKQIS